MHKIKAYQGLRSKFLMVFLLIVAVSAASSCVIVFYYEGQAHRGSLRNKGVSFARYLAELSKEPLLNKDTLALNNIVKSINNDSDMAYAFIYDVRGRLLTGFFSSVNLENACVRKVLDAMPKGSSLPASIIAIRKDADISEVIWPIQVDQDRIGHVVIGLSEVRIREIVQRSLMFILLGNLAGCVIAFGLVLILEKVFIAPIIRLVRLMHRVSSDQDFSVRATVSGNDELGELAVGFNDMLAQIQERDTELLAHRNNLEALIQERTYELSLLGERQRAILESAGEGIIGLDKNGCHTFVNRAACQILGLSREDMIGKPAHAMWHHTRLDGAPCPDEDCKILGALHHGGGAVVDDDIFWRANRVWFPVEYVVTPIKENWQVVGAVVVFRDITVRKQAQEAVERARQAAEAASKTKSDFLANMSHEIRTPMNSILGFAGLLERAGLPDVQQKYVDNIKSSGQLLLALINDILDISKIEAGKIELENIDFDMQHLVEDLVRIIYPKAQEKGLELVVSTENGMLRWFKGDPTRIRQIILNLLNNAVKFTDQGKVTVHVGLAPERTTDRRQEKVEISIKDTGIGIPHDKQAKLFQTFSQADSSITRRFGGTGLGLSIARSLANRMGGDIEMRSQEGSGAEFIVTLVLVRATEHVPEGQIMVDNGDRRSGRDVVASSAEEEASLAGIRILVAEDIQSNWDLLAAYFEIFGCVGDRALNGLEAIEKLRANKYDLCLMDVQMPVMGGLEATRVIRKELGGGIPVVALTAAVMKEDRERAFVAGVDDFLMKPIDPDQLKAAILKWGKRKA